MFINNVTSCYGSSCANNGKGAFNTPDTYACLSFFFSDKMANGKNRSAYTSHLQHFAGVRESFGGELNCAVGNGLIKGVVSAKASGES